jgi:hypothetical protein
VNFMHAQPVEGLAGAPARRTRRRGGSSGLPQIEQSGQAGSGGGVLPSESVH